MNANDPNSSEQSKNSQQNPQNKKDSSIPSQTPQTTPLASPNEPTRAYPNDPSKTYSSDPSQYATSHSPSEKPPIMQAAGPIDSARMAGENKRTIENEAKKEKEQQTSGSKKDPFTDYSKLKGDVFNYMTINREQTIIYILLILGLILILFASTLLGGLIIGMVAGYYFAADIIHYLRNIGQIAGGQNQLRYVVLAALGLGLFIAAPGIFIGAIVVATFKQVLAGPQG